VTGREIVQDVLYRLRLVDRRGVWKPRDEPLKGWAWSDQREGAPASPLRDAFGKVFRRGMNFSLGFGAAFPPSITVRSVERQLSGIRGVWPDQSQLGGRN
jgi:hypothetical protein